MSQSSTAPIIKDSRIPRQLQAVFLSSARGALVDQPPSGQNIAFKVFPKDQKPKKQGLKFGADPASATSRGPRLLFAGCHTKEFDKSKPVSETLRRKKPHGTSRPEVLASFIEKTQPKAEQSTISRRRTDSRSTSRSRSLHRRSSGSAGRAERRESQ
jgi:hypothetical protein